MNRVARSAVLITAVVLALLVARHRSAEVLVRFQSPHLVRSPAATLDDDLAHSIDARLDAAAVASVDGLLQASLDITGRGLYFGLSHATTLRFGAAEREANCIEYAHLFAAVFNRGAHRSHVSARAFVVHSDARVLGEKLSVRGLADHDWVLVVLAAQDAKRIFVDPTFYDLGLEWDIGTSVVGPVPRP